MKIIDKNIFEELNKLMMLKKDYQIFLTDLKSKPYINKISLSKGSVEIYLDDNDIEYLIKYYEEKIEKINEKLSKFSLTKLNDEIEIIEELKKIEKIQRCDDIKMTHYSELYDPTENEKILGIKLNELIDEVNKLKGEK
jgi:hypothetical protein